MIASGVVRTQQDCAAPPESGHAVWPANLEGETPTPGRRAYFFVSLSRNSFSESADNSSYCVPLIRPIWSMVLMSDSWVASSSLIGEHDAQSALIRLGFWDGVQRLRLSEKRAFQKAKFAALYGLFRSLIEVRCLAERRTPRENSKLEQSRTLAHGCLSVVSGLVENEAADLHHHRPAVVEGSQQSKVRRIVGRSLPGQQETKL